MNPLSPTFRNVCTSTPTIHNVRVPTWALANTSSAHGSTSSAEWRHASSALPGDGVDELKRREEGGKKKRTRSERREGRERGTRREVTQAWNIRGGKGTSGVGGKRREGERRDRKNKGRKGWMRRGRLDGTNDARCKMKRTTQSTDVAVDGVGEGGDRKEGDGWMDGWMRRGSGTNDTRRKAEADDAERAGEEKEGREGREWMESERAREPAANPERTSRAAER
ncbi:hypothetical protein C8J57DRAFT_1229350 [Mycena rebaudengoi]|nr:hypothetical protein C8J57DRAFT_1229350 [Mycena rebaudengoi]